MAYFEAVPFEISELILDFLHDDHKSLSSSSLVCRSWVPTTRHHLFNRLFLKHRTGLSDRRSITSFISLAGSSRCTFLPAIRTLVFEFDLVHYTDQIRIAFKLLSPCPSLTALEVMKIWGSRSYPEVPQLSWIANVLPGIRDLTFASYLVIPDNVYRLSASFPELRSLSFKVLSCPQGRAHPPPSGISGASFTHLRTLHLSIEDPEIFINSFRSIRDWKPQLETLKLCIASSSHDGWRCGDATNSFLKANESTLINLSLSREFLFASFPENKSKSGEAVDLSPLSNLRSLAIKTHNVDNICELLLTVTNPYLLLEVVTIEIIVWHFADYGADLLDDAEPCNCVPSLALERLANVIQREQLCGIKKFEIRIPSQLGNEWSKLVAKYFRSGSEGMTLKVVVLEME